MVKQLELEMASARAILQAPQNNTDARTRMLRGRNTMTTCGQLTCNLPGIGRIAQDEQQPVSKVFLVWLWVTFSPNG
ncbi:hypothetical protein PPTG_23101 [Phytophthora nicotianae INRA-310]|uniref:Uncharacterized protein n=1 Tax=Phytophthora nicotianae (strain INRA-310) TaxID=761204 RepID=W2Q439_PHYN3|nr:hypothetical protein PPTG_23101 [Phytophthora nicotianae INRA-310]ETN07912.1 hypothetical protein PPTG_23101 [Phytophthora nicotianae INRA-310]